RETGDTFTRRQLSHGGIGGRSGQQAIRVECAIRAELDVLVRDALKGDLDRLPLVASFECIELTGLGYVHTGAARGIQLKLLRERDARQVDADRVAGFRLRNHQARVAEQLGRELLPWGSDLSVVPARLELGPSRSGEKI